MLITRQHVQAGGAQGVGGGLIGGDHAADRRLGASRAAQLDDAFAAATLAPDADTKGRLDAMTAEYRLGDALR